MPIINPSKGKFVNPQLCYTGTPARSATHLQPAWNTFQYLRGYGALQYVASYIGRPVIDDNGNEDADFYVITGFPEKVGTTTTTRDLFLYLLGWSNTNLAGNETIVWHDVVGDAGVSLYDTGCADSQTDTAATGPTGAVHAHNVTVTPVAIGTDDGFKMSHVDCDNILPACLLVAGAPATSTLDADQAVTPLTQFEVHSPLRGIDESTAPDDFGNIGALAYYQNTDDSVAHNSRSCMMQVCYPVGNYAEDTVAYTDTRADGTPSDYTYKLMPRQGLWTTSDVSCDLALCISGDNGAKIKLSTTVAGDSWIYTLAGGCNKTLIVGSDGDGDAKLDVRVAGDYLKIESLTEEGNDLTIHTVSIWEPGTIA